MPIRDLNDIDLFALNQYNQVSLDAQQWLFELAERRRFYRQPFSKMDLSSPFGKVSAIDSQYDILRGLTEKFSDVGNWINGEFIFCCPATLGSYFSSCEFKISRQELPIRFLKKDAPKELMALEGRLVIDFAASDADLREAFDQILRAYRSAQKEIDDEFLRTIHKYKAPVNKRGVVPRIGDDILMSWKQCGLLLYLDVTHWEAVTGNRVAKPALAAAIYGDKEHSQKIHEVTMKHSSELWRSIDRLSKQLYGYWRQK